MSRPRVHASMTLVQRYLHLRACVDNMLDEGDQLKFYRDFF